MYFYGNWLGLRLHSVYKYYINTLLRHDSNFLSMMKNVIKIKLFKTTDY